MNGIERDFSVEHLEKDIKRAKRLILAGYMVLLLWQL